MELYQTGRVLSLVLFLSITLGGTGWGCCRAGVSHSQEEAQEIESSNGSQQGGDIWV